MVMRGSPSAVILFAQLPPVINWFELWATVDSTNPKSKTKITSCPANAPGRNSRSPSTRNPGELMSIRPRNWLLCSVPVILCRYGLRWVQADGPGRQHLPNQVPRALHLQQGRGQEGSGRQQTLRWEESTLEGVTAGIGQVIAALLQLQRIQEEVHKPVQPGPRWGEDSLLLQVRNT